MKNKNIYNTLLIQTEWGPWLWSESRYGYFIIKLDKDI